MASASTSEILIGLGIAILGILIYIFKDKLTQTIGTDISIVGILLAIVVGGLIGFGFYTKATHP
jgi:hypothetical protein